MGCFSEQLSASKLGREDMCHKGGRSQYRDNTISCARAGGQGTRDHDITISWYPRPAARGVAHDITISRCTLGAPTEFNSRTAMFELKPPCVNSRIAAFEMTSPYVNRLRATPEWRGAVRPLRFVILWSHVSGPPPATEYRYIVIACRQLLSH